MRLDFFSRLQPFFAVFAIAVGFLAAGSVCAYEPPGLDELRDRIARRQAEIAANPPQGEVLLLDSLPAPEGTAMAIYNIALLIEQLEERGDFRPSERRHLAKAKDAAKAAFENYGLSPDLKVVFRNLAESARALQAAAPPGHRLQAGVTEIAKQLAQAANAIARDIAALARRAFVRERHLRVIETHLANGERSLQASLYIAAIGQFGGATNFAANTITFDIDLFEQNIRDALDGETVGYAYAIGRQGQLYASGHGGNARTSADAPETDQSSTKEMYIASITKTISAVALLKALDAAGISVDESIAPYLPADWTQGDGVEDITFRYLMTHRSGLPEAGNQTLEELEQAIAAGTPGLLAFSAADYTNTNFSLLRVLVPRIALGPATIDVYTNVLPADLVYAEVFADYVFGEVLFPAGINAQSCSPREADATRTRYYLFGAPVTDPGVDLGDWGLRCGATGYYLSAIELGSLLAHMRYTDEIIDDEIRALMNDGFLGWLNPVTFSDFVDSATFAGDWGVYRGHGGDSHNSAVPGMTSCMMNYPIHVEAVVLVNSRGNGFSGHVCTVLRDAFDNAWVAK